MPNNTSKKSKYNLRFSNLKTAPLRNTLALIGIIIIASCVGAAYIAGWITPQRLTQSDIVSRFEKLSGPHEGFRRNHAKGVCFTGYFDGNGAGGKISKASLFKVVRTPVTGRFSLAGPNPFQSDKASQVRSMALSFDMEDGQVFRTAMNNIPVFAVKDVQGFYDLLLASKPEPKTRRPDPEKMEAFFTKYPESRTSISIIKSRSISSGFANARYNGLNTFYFINDLGNKTPVRWSMVPVDPFVSSDEIQKNDTDNFLFDALKSRLKEGPAQWSLEVVLGEKDNINDASKPWPPERQRITTGILTVTDIQNEDDGKCRDINFDPLILPKGILPSNDPLLSGRSAVYAKSHAKRAREIKAPSPVQFLNEGTHNVE